MEKFVIFVYFNVNAPGVGELLYLERTINVVIESVVEGDYGRAVCFQ